MANSVAVRWMGLIVIAALLMISRGYSSYAQRSWDEVSDIASRASSAGEEERPLLSAKNAFKTQLGRKQKTISRSRPKMEQKCNGSLQWRVSSITALQEMPKTSRRHTPAAKNAPGGEDWSRPQSRYG